VNELAARVFGTWIRRVDRTSVRADLIAGLLGALLVLPQGIAFATLAGLPPEYGLYTAVVPCVVAALFGSSWHVVSGPTNANSLALFATLAPLAAVGSPAYIALALAVTVLVGTIQFVIGALRLGTIANFISPAALRGFMAGAAALIAVYAIPDLLGLPPPTAHRLGNLAEHLWTHLDRVAPAALLVGIFTIVASLLLKSLLPRMPYMLFGLLLATVLAFAVDRWWTFGAQRIAVVGPIPPIWPRFSLPVFDLSVLPDLIGIAFALTIVALGQSISIAKAVAARSGQHIDGNREFRGQGLSNIVGGLFSSYVSCGSLNRSFPNFEAGARTPLAAVFASVLLVLLTAVSARLLALIPMPAIAALLLLISWSLLDCASWRQLWRFSRQDFAVAAATFVHRLHPPRGRGPARDDPVSCPVPLPHVQAGDPDHGLRRHGCGAAVRRPQRRREPAARVPAAEDDPHGRRGLLRRGVARQRPAARPARAGELAQAPARDVQEHELHRPRRRRDVAHRAPRAPRRRRRPLFPPPARTGARALAADRLHGRARHRSHLPGQADRDRDDL
jgi:SulP family sulfate permease